ncbi:MAG: KAP family NTPase [Notoacmeibacter sp.]|nr:KAP family NTPase [Notoacmeibacter sp.]
MSVENVKAQIARFLDSETAEVLCIRGNWGTGKTYNWVETLKEAAPKKKVGRDKYAYVSLFGINSLDDLKQEIIHQTIDVDQVGKSFDFQDVESYVKSAFPGLLKLGGLAGKLLGENYTSAGVAVMYMMVRKRLICIDDLERKGEDLRSVDVLGLVSQLREDRNCKVVLLMNDERLEDRVEFESYLEKVVDINLRFSPTAEESAEIALAALEGTNELKELVRERTTKLGIDNVRVIRKLYSFVQQIEPLLQQYKAGVFHSVAHTIVLMGWCHLQPEIAPSKDFLVRRKGVFSDYMENQEGKLTPQEQEWTKLIADYGYSHTDEFDVALLKGIEDGYFTAEIIDKNAAELNQRVEMDLAAGQLRDTWREFLYDFDGDLDDSLTRFKRCITDNAKFYSLNDLISVVNMFRDLDRKEDGDMLLDAYLEARAGVKGTYDFDDLQLFGIRLDPDIKERLLALEEQQKPSLPVEDLFLMLADNGHDRDITERLAALPVEEYVRVLKHHKGNDLFVMRRSLTQYNNLSNPDSYNIEIMRKANDALQKIAQENPGNKYRVSGWGIAERLARLPAEAPQASDSEE